MVDARELPSFALEVDADRDGALEPGEPGHWDWRWSADGPGAIALPDLGQKTPEFELTPLRLSISRCPPGTAVALGLSALAAPFVTVYRKEGDALLPVLGSDAAANLPKLVAFTQTTDVDLTARSCGWRPGS
jgi:hypothetical protein